MASQYEDIVGKSGQSGGSQSGGGLPGGGTWKKYDNSNSPTQIYNSGTVQYGNNQFTHPGGAARDSWYNYLQHPDHAGEKEAAGRLNELGFWDTMPGANIGPEAQYESEAAVARYNQRLGYAANEAMRQGALNMQSYRPGGSAAMLSPFYQGQANTLLSMRTEAPDNTFRWRAVQADRAAKAARRTQLLSTGISAAAMLGSAAIGALAPAGAAAGGVGAAIGGAAQGLGTALGGYYMGQGMSATAGNASSGVGYEAQSYGAGATAGYATGSGAVGQPVTAPAESNPLSAGGTPTTMPAQSGGATAPGGPSAPSPQGGPGGPAPQGGPGGPEGAPGSPGGGPMASGGGGMQGPMGMGGGMLGSQGAMGFTGQGMLNAYPQLTGMPQEVAYAFLHEEAGLNDGFWGGYQDEINALLGEQFFFPDPVA